jgi:hypothetical protein
MSDARNSNPHKPALIAMYVYRHEYAEQRGGAMDFWDSLSFPLQAICRELARRVVAAPDEFPNSTARDVET